MTALTSARALTEWNLGLCNRGKVAHSPVTQFPCSPMPPIGGFKMSADVGHGDSLLH